MGVHCSAGIGRTGTFMATDITLRRLLAAGNVDLMSTVSHMRQERAGSVQTIAQYRFLYDALREYVVLNGVQPVASAAVAADAELTTDEINALALLAGPETAGGDDDLINSLQLLAQK